VAGFTSSPVGGVRLLIRYRLVLGCNKNLCRPVPDFCPSVEPHSPAAPYHHSVHWQGAGKRAEFSSEGGNFGLNGGLILEKDKTLPYRWKSGCDRVLALSPSLSWNLYFAVLTASDTVPAGGGYQPVSRSASVESLVGVVG